MKNRHIYGCKTSSPQIGQRRLFSGVAIGSTAFALFTVGQAKAQVVTFDTSGNTAAQSIAATFNATQQASGVSGTPQLSRTTLTASTGAIGSFYSNGGNNNTSTLNTAASYVGFSVIPAAGSVLFATAINLTTQGSNSSPNSYAIGYSTDNFASGGNAIVATSTGNTAITATGRTFDITDLITNDTLTTRFYNYGSTSLSGGAAATTGPFRVITPSISGNTATAATDAITLAAATEVRDSGALGLGGTISGAFAITKTGAGTLTLGGSNTYGIAGVTGTTVSAGTLLVNNSAGSGTGVGNVSVSSGTFLGGTGTISGAVNIAGTLSPGTTTAAGSIGTITTGALTLASTSTLAFDITSTTSKDLVALSASALTLNNGKLVLTLPNTTSTGIDYTATYAIATGVSSLSGGFSSVTGYDNTDYTATFALNGNEYDLSFVPVPEPATILGGLLMVSALGWSQRRRLGGLAGSMRTCLAV